MNKRNKLKKVLTSSSMLMLLLTPNVTPLVTTVRAVDYSVLETQIDDCDNGLEDDSGNYKVDIDKAIEWYKDKMSQKITYSQTSRDGLTSYDCSSSLYYALVSAGADKQSYAPNTETEHEFLLANGYELAYEGKWEEHGEIGKTKKGDVFIWGKKGGSSGNAGHTGLFEEDGKVIHCNGGANGISENDYESYKKSVGSHGYVYIYRPKASSGSSQSNSKGQSVSSEMFPIDTLKAIYKVLHDDYGISVQVISAMVGNWYAESHVTAKRVQNTSGEMSDEEAERLGANTNNGIGLGQWTYERNTMLRDFAKEQNKKWWELDVQLAFAVSKDSGAPIIKDIALNSTGDVKKDSVRYLLEWERPADQSSSIQELRASYAEKAYEVFKSNGMTGGKDESKIAKIAGGNASVNTTSVTDATQAEDLCSDDSSTGSKGWQEKGGTSGLTSQGAWKKDDLPENLKEYAIDPTSVGLTWHSSKGWDGASAYIGSGILDQCTTFSSAMYGALWVKDGKPLGSAHGASGNGNQMVGQASSKMGTKVSEEPTSGDLISIATATTPNHTGIVSHVFENGDILIVEQNVTGYSGQGNGESYSWNYSYHTKSELKGYTFTNPSEKGYKINSSAKSVG